MFFRKDVLLKLSSLALLIGFVGMGFGEEVGVASEKKIDFFGSTNMKAGQFVNYKYGTKGHELTNQWAQSNQLGLGLRTQFDPRVKAEIGVFGWLYYNLFPDSMLVDPSRVSKGTAVIFNFDRADIALDLSPNVGDSLLELHIGLEPYKYNRDSRNLGDYLFRTGCFPGYIVQDGLDLAPQIAGIRLSNNLFGTWHNELFLTSELYLYPVNDFSLSYLTDFNIGNGLLNIGAGLQCHRLLSVNNDYTQPQYYMSSVAVPNSTLKAPNYYFTKNDTLHQDTLFYTFAGTKLMGRISFDPKLLLNWDFLGTEDLKLYAEAIILGLESYPANPDSPVSPWNSVPINELGYDDLMQKMPIMFGFNVPMFKLLDVFSMEFEYYGKKYVNRVPVATQGLSMMRLPVPYDNQLNGGYPNGSPEMGGDSIFSRSTYKSGAAQWKWSIYLKRSLFNNFNITLLFARDHYRVLTALPQSIDQEEAFILNNQWHWDLKFGYTF